MCAFKCMCVCVYVCMCVCVYVCFCWKLIPKSVLPCIAQSSDHRLQNKVHTHAHTHTHTHSHTHTHTQTHRHTHTHKHTHTQNAKPPSRPSPPLLFSPGPRSCALLGLTMPKCTRCICFTREEKATTISAPPYLLTSPPSGGFKDNLNHPYTLSYAHTHAHTTHTHTHTHTHSHTHAHTHTHTHTHAHTHTRTHTHLCYAACAHGSCRLSL